MRKTVFAACLVVGCLFTSVLGVTSELYPRFAAGSGWTTILILVNDDVKDAKVTLRLPPSSGLTINDVLLPLATKQEVSGLWQVTFDVLLKSRETKRLSFGYEGPMRTMTGYIAVIGEASITDVRSVLFYEYRDVDGRLIESVPVIGQQPLGSGGALFPVDISADKDTAFLIDYDYTSLYPTAFPMEARAVLFDETGKLVGELWANQRWEGYVSEVFPVEEFPEVDKAKGFKGHLVIMGAPVVLAMFQEFNREKGTFELSTMPPLYCEGRLY